MILYEGATSVPGQVEVLSYNTPAVNSRKAGDAHLCKLRDTPVVRVPNLIVERQTWTMPRLTGPYFSHICRRFAK